MVMLVAEALNVLMRWAHIASVVVLIGGMVYARWVVAPVLAEDEKGLSWLERFTARHRPLVYSAVVGVLVSGLYNFLMHKGHTPYYHMWFGIKILLVLHVFASALLAVRPAQGTPEDDSKRLRRMAGAAISGLLIVLISAYLRRIY